MVKDFKNLYGGVIKVAKQTVIEQKAQLVNEVADKMKSTPAFIAFQYQGLTVEQFQNLRRTLLKDGCHISVIKNNISRRASEQLGYSEFADVLKGAIAIVFSGEDIVAPAKGLFEFAKDNDKVVIEKGVVDGEIYDFAKLQTLATLPSRDTLLTQLAAGMLGTLTQLSIGLNMVAEKQEQAA